MPDDTLQLSGILDDSGLADDGPWRWLGEDGVQGRTAMSAHRMLLPMDDDIQPKDSISVADCCSQNSDDDRLLEAQLALEEARAEALQAKREAEQKDQAVRSSQARLRMAEAQSRSYERSRSRLQGADQDLESERRRNASLDALKVSTSLSDIPVPEQETLEYGNYDDGVQYCTVDYSGLDICSDSLPAASTACGSGQVPSSVSCGAVVPAIRLIATSGGSPLTKRPSPTLPVQATTKRA